MNGCPFNLTDNHSLIYVTQKRKEIKNYVQPIVSYQQLLEERIRACTSIEELEAIEINYSQFSM